MRISSRSFRLRASVGGMRSWRASTLSWRESTGRTARWRFPHRCVPSCLLSSSSCGARSQTVECPSPERIDRCRSRSPGTSLTVSAAWPRQKDWAAGCTTCQPAKARTCRLLWRSSRTPFRRCQFRGSRRDPPVPSTFPAIHPAEPLTEPCYLERRDSNRNIRSCGAYALPCRGGARRWGHSVSAAGEPSRDREGKGPRQTNCRLSPRAARVCPARFRTLAGSTTGRASVTTPPARPAPQVRPRPSMNGRQDARSKPAFDRLRHVMRVVAQLVGPWAREALTRPVWMTSPWSRRGRRRGTSGVRRSAFALCWGIAAIG